LTWTVTNQTNFQWRQVGDFGGNPDPNTIYYDNGNLNGPAVRSATIYFNTNNRVEHVQVRVFYNNLWSAWADAKYTVAYTPPAVPTSVTITPDPVGGFILISVVNPAPTGAQPTVAGWDIYRRLTSLPGTAGIRIYTMQTGNYPDRTVPSAIAHQYQIVLIGTNGASYATGWYN
jgi:hypothetical protein